MVILPKLIFYKDHTIVGKANSD